MDPISSGHSGTAPRALDVIVGTRPLIDEDVRRHRQLLEKIGARVAEPDPRVERRQALASEAGRT